MTKWISIATGILATLALAIIVAYFAGVRVFVIQPIGAIPEGVTIVVTSVPGLNFVDSPDAYCYRKQGYVNLLCRGAITGAVGNRGNILIKLPYNQMLYDVTGAPEVDR